MSRRLVAAAAAAAALCAAVVAVVAHDALLVARGAPGGRRRSMCIRPTQRALGARGHWFPGDPAGLAVHASRDVDAAPCCPDAFVVAVRHPAWLRQRRSPARGRGLAAESRTDGGRRRRPHVRPPHRRTTCSECSRRLGRHRRDRRRTRTSLRSEAAVRADPSNLDAKLQPRARCCDVSGATSVRRGPGNGSGASEQRSAWCRRPEPRVGGTRTWRARSSCSHRSPGSRALGAILPVGCVVLVAHRGRRVARHPRPPTRRPRGRSDRVQRRRSRSARSSASPLRSRSCRRRGPSTFANRPRCSSSSTSPVRWLRHPTWTGRTLATRARQERRAHIFARAVPDVPVGVAGLTDRILPYRPRNV